MEKVRVDPWRRIAGWALLVGPIQFVAAMALEEALRPGYDPVTEVISELGKDAYSGIFNTSVILLGILTIVGIVAVSPTFPWNNQSRTAKYLLILTGIGAIFVGIFPMNKGFLHTLSAVVAFLGSGLGLLFFFPGCNLDKRWGDFALPSLIGGIVTFVAIFLFAAGPLVGNIVGLTERAIVAPILLWAPFVAVRFHSQTMSPKEEPSPEAGR
jgi:hypothetical membrane protein